MKWSQIGADGWRLPAANAKTKVGHLVPLSITRREILEGVPQIGEHVFIARKDARCRDGARPRPTRSIVTLERALASRGHAADCRNAYAVASASIGSW